MSPPFGVTPSEALPSGGRVHVIGAGPVGLLLTAMLQSIEGFSIRLYEKRREYTRTRMVQLASYLIADSLLSLITEDRIGRYPARTLDLALTYRDRRHDRSLSVPGASR